MRPRFLLLVLLLWCYHRPSVIAKRSQGILSSKNDFVYLDRFCFQSDTGALEYSFKYPLFYPTQMLLLYFDTEDQWPRAYKELQTCEDRIQLLTNHSDNNQIIFLSPYVSDIAGNGRCQIYRDSLLQEWVSCAGTRVFHSARSRWWFLALANCDPSESEERRLFNNETMGVYAEFALQMTNGMPSEFLKHQFSIDEWLILPTDTVFLLLQVGLIALAILMGRSLTARRLLHNTYRLCTQSIIFNTLGLAFLVFHYVLYALDGVGISAFMYAGQVIRALADMLFMHVCLVLARGLNVTKMRLTTIDKVFLAIMFVFFICTYLLMQIWDIKFFDPASVFSKSESVPGYLLSVWRLTAWVFFVVAALFSRSSSPRKASFFTNFVLLMTPWFWAPPIFALIANVFLNNWVRAEVVNIVENCVTSYGYLVFLYLSRPSDNNENFPFHIRTTQVDIDTGFDPQTAYAPRNGEEPPNDGMHGVSLPPPKVDDKANNKDKESVDIHEEEENAAPKPDLGVIERPQFAR